MLGKLSVPGRPTNLANSFNVCRVGLFGHLFSRLTFLFSFSVSGRRPDIG